MSKIVYVKHYTREMIRHFHYNLFVFGDNMIRTGYGGQAAAARDEPNAVGIPTKWEPNSKPSSYFVDDDFDKVVPVIDKEFKRLWQHPNKIVWPMDGIGTGLAQLDVRAPKIFNYIEYKKLELELEKW